MTIDFVTSNPWASEAGRGGVPGAAAGDLGVVLQRLCDHGLRWGLWRHELPGTPKLESGGARMGLRWMTRFGGSLEGEKVGRERAMQTSSAKDTDKQSI